MKKQKKKKEEEETINLLQLSDNYKLPGTLTSLPIHPHSPKRRT